MFLYYVFCIVQCYDLNFVDLVSVDVYLNFKLYGPYWVATIIEPKCREWFSWKKNSAVFLQYFNCEILIWCILWVMAFARSLNFMDHAEWPQLILLKQNAGSSFHENNSAVLVQHFNIEIWILCILWVMAFAWFFNFMDRAEWPQ